MISSCSGRSSWNDVLKRCPLRTPASRSVSALVNSDSVSSPSLQNAAFDFRNTPSEARTQNPTFETAACFCAIVFDGAEGTQFRCRRRKPGSRFVACRPVAGDLRARQSHRSPGQAQLADISFNSPRSPFRRRRSPKMPSPAATAAVCGARTGPGCRALGAAPP